MDKFFEDLKNILEKYNNDVTVLDDYELDESFVAEVMSGYYEKHKSKILSIQNIHVFDGPNVGTLSISLSVRFDIKILPHYNIEECKKVNIFVKIPVFDEPSVTSRTLCSKEVRVYEDYLKDLKDFHDHPIKGPYCSPTPTLLHSCEKGTSAVPSMLGPQ